MYLYKYIYIYIDAIIIVIPQTAFESDKCIMVICMTVTRWASLVSIKSVLLAAVDRLICMNSLISQIHQGDKLTWNRRRV